VYGVTLDENIRHRVSEGINNNDKKKHFWTVVNNNLYVGGISKKIWYVRRWLVG
jgi:hypothetical protein